jgi:hypothetical protein
MGERPGQLLIKTVTTCYRKEMLLLNLMTILVARAILRQNLFDHQFE